MKRIHYYIITGLCLLLSLIVMADSGRLYTSDKLSSSLINCITQDRNGFIWVGTEYGLSKFDGYRFTNYLHNDKDTTSINDNIISAFLVDRSGKLWIGSAKGLMRYSYESNNFIRYPFPKGNRPRIYTMIESHKGDIVIGTAGRGLFSIKKGAGRITYEKDYAKKDTDMFYTHIFEDNRGCLWQSSHLNVFTRFYKKSGRMHIQDFESPYGAPVKFFQSLKNNLFIVCMYGIEIYDYTTNKITDAGYDLGSYKGNITINCARFDHKGNLYIGTSECGVLVAKAGTKTFLPFEGNNSQRFNLSASWVNDIFEDKDQNLWVGCYKKGLYLVNNQKEAFNIWSFSAQNYSIGSSVSSLAAGNNGEIWCTVQNSGVYKFDGNGKIVSHLPSPYGTSIIYRDSWGRYWLGTGHALFSYNPEAGTYKEEMKFASAGIYCIADDGKGKLYISVYSKGLYIYDSIKHTVKILNVSKQSSHGSLCNDWIRSLTFDRQGQLWIGTSNGVACMNPETFAFDSYGWNSILRNMQSNYLCEDNNGNMIIGTDRGLYIYNMVSRKATAFPGAEILRNKQICGIVKDAHDDIWISTTMGIWQYDHQEKKFIAHINGNGLHSHEYTLGAVIHGGNDFVGFGSADGITTFYPEDVRNNRTEMTQVYLTSFIVDGKQISCMQDEFKLPYNQNSFSLEFSLLNYKSTDDISFMYRINNGGWSSTEEGENEISFNELKPGDYNIEVRAESNGVISKESKTIHITVKDPWYASSLAYIIYAAMIGGFAFYFFRTYDRRRKADFEEQKMRFLIDATHDIRSPLTLIMGPLNKLKARLTDEDNQRDIKTIDRNAQRLLLLVNQILDERKIDKNQMSLHCEETNVTQLANGVISLYLYNAQERNIKISVKSENPDLKLWIDHINFEKVISNLMSNAIKYTFDGGTIDVLISNNDTYANIKIIDSGIGFKDEKTERLFERFYQGKNTNEFHFNGTGIGLNLCRAIVKMHGGNIRAYNRNDDKTGACIEISIPMGKGHLKPEEIMQSEPMEKNSARKKQASKNYKILVVDDDYEIIQYIKDELSCWYKFDYAGNGRDGLKKLLTEEFDLVISDVMMPEMDGITMLKKIKSNNNISDIPVILLTSKSEVSDRLEGLKRGADAFLAKPFAMEELHILIDNLIDNVRRLRGKFSGAQNQNEKIEKVEVKGNNDALMDRIMKCINENLGNPDFNVEKLTEEVGISRAQLHRKMKEITGISTGEFIRNLRLEQAARLIREGEINVTQVAYAVGFNNQTHFSTVFKKHFGMTPTEYNESENK